MNFNVTKNFIKIDEGQDDIDEYPYILEEKKTIKFMRDDNTIIRVKIPISLKKNELYLIANNYKLRKFSDIILSHKNIILNNDDSSINEIEKEDEILIIEELEGIDPAYYKKYLEKHKGDRLINIKFEKSNGSKKSKVFSVNTKIKEMIKIYLFEENIPEKHKNKFFFIYDTNSLNINDTLSLSQKGINDQSIIKVIEMNIVGNDKVIIKGKKLKATFKKKKEIIKTCYIGTLNQVEDLFSHLNDLPNSKDIINIKIKEKIFENDETRTLSSFGIRNDFICEILYQIEASCTIL